MREIKVKKVNDNIINVIAKNYDHLKELCKYHDDILLCPKNSEDLFQDTILYISQDAKAVNMSEEELISYFCFRYKMIKYRAIKDKQQLKKIQYAEYIQTSKKEEEEE